MSGSWNLENDTDKRAAKHYTQQTAGRPISQAHGKLDGEVARQARHARHPRSILEGMSRVSDVSARMSRGCYEETASVEFSFNAVLVQVCDTFYGRFRTRPTTAEDCRAQTQEIGYRRLGDRGFGDVIESGVKI